MVNHTPRGGKRSTQDGPDDLSLLAAAVEGDRQAFERIYLACKDDFLKLAAMMLSDWQAAECPASSGARKNSQIKCPWQTPHRQK
jgi:hypothetical protein